MENKNEELLDNKLNTEERNEVTASNEAKDSNSTAESSEDVSSNALLFDSGKLISKVVSEVNDNDLPKEGNEVVVSNEEIESKTVEKEALNNKQYNVTLFFCYFAGGLGIHRLINGKKVSGVILLVMSIILLPLTLILLTFGIMNDNIALTIVGMASISLCGTIGIWVVVDFYTIILGKFKNSKNEDVKFSGSFFKSWANVLAVVVNIITIIVFAISPVFLVDPIDNAFQDYLDGEYNLQPTIEVEESKAESFKKNMGIISDAIYSTDKSKVVFDDYDAIIDPINDYFTDLGYEVDIDRNKDVITFSKNRTDFDFIVAIILDDTDEGYLIEECIIGVAIEESGVEYYSYVHTDGDKINDSEEVGYIVSVSSLDPDFFYFGNYKPDEDSVTLLDADSKGNKEYDSEKDEYKIIDTLKEITNELIDEEEDIFDY